MGKVTHDWKRWTQMRDWYVSLVRSQCYAHSDSALLEGAELVNKIPQTDRLTFMTNKKFNMSMLGPCLALGVNQMIVDQDSSFFETTQSVLLDLISQTVQQLPDTHQIFQPLKPMEKDSYWEKLIIVLGDSEVYYSLVTLCRALAQYLLSLPKIPQSFHIRQENEVDIMKFVVMSVEAVSWHFVQEPVPLSVDLQAVLECCCLTLQQPGLWNLVASAEYVTQACSLITCIRFIIEAVAVQPGEQLLSPERKKDSSSEDQEGDEVDSGVQGAVFIKTACTMMSEMVDSLQTVLLFGHKRNNNIAAFLTPVLRNIIVSLARLPAVNSYTRVPPLV
ncbi:unnamed protein product, partial [Staurois parvus]